VCLSGAAAQGVKERLCACAYEISTRSVDNGRRGCLERRFAEDFSLKKSCVTCHIMM
jgi:hypothetical protein